MKHTTQVALLATLMAATASAQDVTVTSTTLAQDWKQDTPGFTKASLAPITEFLAIDASKLGSDKLSMHLYGWGMKDMQDQSALGGKSAGNLTYGYLQYSFDRANAEIKAGRFTVNQGVGNEQVDGVAARTDLKGGFYVSAFGGTPVIFKNLSNMPQSDLTLQRDIIFGARLAWRIPKSGELGLSYLEDGSTPGSNLPTQTVDYTRRQVGADLRFSCSSYFDFSGRTVFDVANHPAVLPGADARPKIAEHDYQATVRFSDTLTATGNFVERNFYAYFAGSTLPSLFNMNEKGLFRATGGNVTWGVTTGLQVVADIRRTERELYGNTTRAGADLRYKFGSANLMVGAGYHKVNAFHVQMVDEQVAAFSLTHSEERAWAIYEKGNFSASLDGIVFHYTDAEINPSLNGKGTETQLVGSLGYKLGEALKVSGDLSMADTAFYSKQVMGLVRLEYRFGFASKGGK